jgi:hypothetical protein
MTSSVMLSLSKYDSIPTPPFDTLRVTILSIKDFRSWRYLVFQVTQ